MTCEIKTFRNSILIGVAANISDPCYESFVRINNSKLYHGKQQNPQFQPLRSQEMNIICQKKYA